MMQIKRMARSMWGIMPKYARKLFISIMLPRALYAADVWSNPRSEKKKSSRGATKVISQLTSI
jgi:hypothetical protein